MYDIAAIGELLIDFTPRGDGSFMPNPGGAPCNFLAMAQKLGSRTVFVGKVGEDAFGSQLKEAIEQAGIDSSGLIQDHRYMTTLAFVHLSQSGERSFSFYRKGCADVMLTKEDVNRKYIDEAKAFHFGSLSLTEEPIRSTVLDLLEYAKSESKLITYDPNYRQALWNSQDEAVAYMIKGARFADIMKISEEEMWLITGTCDCRQACEILHGLGVACVTVTLGNRGAYFSYPGGSGQINAYSTKAVDTTGAGDAFFGTFIHLIVQSGTPVNVVPLDVMSNYVRRANAAASLCIERYGGMPSMPDKNALENRMSS